MSIIKQFVTLGLALILLSAGAYKLSDVRLFEVRLEAIFPQVDILWIRLVGCTVPGVELMLGVCLLTGWKFRTAVNILPFLTIAFIGVSVYMWVERKTGCGCAKFLENSWWSHGLGKMILCVGLFAASLWLCRNTPPEPEDETTGTS